jgi:fused signal recognition particle receptor
MSFLNIFAKSKIGDQLKNSSQKISSFVSQIFTHKKLDHETLQELEDTLIINDLGTEVAKKIVQQLKSQKFEKNLTTNEIKIFLASEIENILLKCQKPLPINDSQSTQVLVFNGINGAGKTTTIGKIAYNLKQQGKSVLIAACDTFRAAAISQLSAWASKANCQLVLPLKDQEDPASVAYRALDLAQQQKIDVLLIDTAGRLHNKQNLMDELKKINNVLKKLDQSAPHCNLLIIDATNGQNAKNQTENFNKIIGIDGLIITKLDGTSKGGIAVALAHDFAKPIFAIGVGEKITDLQEFNAKSFTYALLDIENS